MLAESTPITVAAWLLIASAFVFVVSGMLFTGRVIWKWPVSNTARFLRTERGFVMAAILLATLGFVLLQQLLAEAGERLLAPLGSTVFLIAAVLFITAESSSLDRQEWPYAQIVVAIYLAFVGQALFGFSILRSSFQPAWVGWVTVFWNLAWPIILPFARPKDIYYPWLHYVAPLLIGITLLALG